jgi:hypothetical protein
MPLPRLDRDLARAIGQDAANAQMRKQGRTQWNLDDWNLAARITNDLVDKIEQQQPKWRGEVK